MSTPPVTRCLNINIPPCSIGPRGKMCLYEGQTAMQRNREFTGWLHVSEEMKHGSITMKTNMKNVICGILYAAVKADGV